MAKKIPKEKSKKISQGVSKLVNQFEKTGKIETERATYKPESKKKAIKQALAIEYGKNKVGRAGSK